MKETLFVSFSGGRTSGYMCQWLIENKSDEYDLIFVFANTGLEHEKTLEFVDKCDKHMGLNLVWVEAVVNPEKGKGIRHKIVDFESAARNGEPYEQAVAKYGVFNQSRPQCTWRLKVEVMDSYKVSLGFKRKHKSAVGIRSDEINRVSDTAEENGIVYPLVTMTMASKAEVINWWSDQPFDLEIPEHYGNCVTCWKKSDRKLMTIAKHEPDYFKFFDKIEKTYGKKMAQGDPLVCFRGKKSAQDIIAASQGSFAEFNDQAPPLQLGMFPPDEKVARILGMDEMDIEEDCGSGCEIT